MHAYVLAHPCPLPVQREYEWFCLVQTTFSQIRWIFLQIDVCIYTRAFVESICTYVKSRAHTNIHPQLHVQSCSSGLSISSSTCVQYMTHVDVYVKIEWFSQRVHATPISIYACTPAFCICKPTQRLIKLHVHMHVRQHASHTHTYDS
jgi:hypothetical protein